MKAISETKVLVTGASGFLGSFLAERLSADGYKVYALLRRNSSKQYLKNIEGIRLVYGDLLDIRSLRSAVKDMDVVINCAALMSNYDWLSRGVFYRVNCAGTKNMLDASISQGVKHFIHISTVGVLGGSDKPVYLDEEAPYGRRLSKYEWSKCEAERVLLRYIKNYNLPITIVRPAQLYGPRMLYGWLPTLKSIRNAKFMIIGSGSPLIHPTHVDDAIDAIASLILKKESFGEIFHIAGPQAISLKSLFFTIAQHLDVPLPKCIPYVFTYWISAIAEGIPHFMKSERLSLLTRHRVRFFKENHAYNTNKAKSQLGYGPKTGLDAGIKNMVDWFIDNGHLEK